MPRTFRNTYFALRHGISLANEQGLIISLPENGTCGWGLSPAGAAHCRERLAPHACEYCFAPERTVTIASDFTRARETAEVFCALHGLAAPQLDPRLRERCFGQLEKLQQDAYLAIWEQDVVDATHHLKGCESTDEVAARLRQLLAECEQRYQDRDIVLVSHGDPLQILETIFRGLPSNRHRTLSHLGNAELRRL
ncbi:MAG TPA: histidine phosphatase family protein [Terriglobales bacterium]|nr:histidine phosphatase family protein [Terriglobales bacterium]